MTKDTRPARRRNKAVSKRNLVVRITEEELAALREDAEEAGISVSDLVRSALGLTLASRKRSP